MNEARDHQGVYNVQSREQQEQEQREEEEEEADGR